MDVCYRGKAVSDLKNEAITISLELQRWYNNWRYDLQELSTCCSQGFRMSFKVSILSLT